MYQARVIEPSRCMSGIQLYANMKLAAVVLSTSELAWRLMVQPIRAGDCKRMITSFWTSGSDQIGGSRPALVRSEARARVGLPVLL